jgi:uncharacterized membrane protein SpoIIM required for sporulation
MTTAATPRTQAVSSLRVVRAWQTFHRTMSNALIVTRREVADSLRDWRIIAPILILTFLFPALSQFGANLMLRFVTQYGAELIGERTIPFLLMIVGFFPISLSLVIALETFVGEKERRSLEPLLSTPLTNLELYIGKTLAAAIPPLLASYLGMAVYLVGLLIAQVILLTTAQALLMVTGAVVVSSQTTSTRAANLLASFIIVPMSLLIILESIIMFGAPDAESPNGIFALWVILAGLLIGMMLFMRIGTRIFRREELLNSSMDMLNVRWIGRTFWRHFRGEDRPGLVDWYRREAFGAVRRLGRPVVAVTVCVLAAFVGGWVAGLTTTWQIPPGSVVDRTEMTQNFRLWFELGSNPTSVLLAVWQNGRVLLAATIMAVISFGVMAAVLALIPFGILGWSLSQFVLLGVVPHSLVEVPAIILASAAAFRLGAIITHELPKGQTVGEEWLRAAADALKVGLGVVLPMLVVAALIEVFITPVLVRLALGA